jgi:putative FmdB family regulatory protein
MPIYEYSCSKCGKTIEVIQKFSDPVLKKHQGCGGTLTKLVSASAFQLKGTGWYVTDYARKGKSGDSEGTKETTDKKESPPKSETPAKESTKKTAGKSGKSSE